MTKKLNDIKLSVKLYSAVAVMIVMVAVMGGVGLAKTRSIQASMTQLVDREFTAMEELEHCRGLMLQVRLNYYLAFTSASSDRRGELAEEAGTMAEEVSQHLAKLVELTTLIGDSSQAEALQKAWNEYTSHYKPLMKLVVGSPAAASKSVHLAKVREIAGARITDSFTSLDNQLIAAIEVSRKKADESVASAFWVIGGIFGALTILSLVGGVLVVRMIIRPISQLSDRLNALNINCLTGISSGLKALANGDLTYPVEATTKPLPEGGNDEFGQLARTFNEMLAKVQACVRDLSEAQNGLTEVVSAIKDRAHQVWNTDSRGSSQGVALALKEVTQTMSESAHTAQEMAGGSESLARVAGDAAATMDQVDRSIINVNDAASAVLSQAETMAEGASTGMESLDKMVRALKEMAVKSDSSMNAVRQLGEKQDEINSIVQTIEEIADQTNLLALNAAIEAARAGEHGRGFAVVAEEVRKLAERAASSTQQISSLIDEVRSSVALTTKEMASATESVKQGQALSEEASVVLSQIAAGASEVRELAVAAQTQATSLAEQASQVTGMVSNVASISEESAAGSQEISAGLHEVSASAGQVSEDLSIIASGLASDVERFRLKAA